MGVVVSSIGVWSVLQSAVYCPESSDPRYNAKGVATDLNHVLGRDLRLGAQEKKSKYSIY